MHTHTHTHPAQCSAEMQQILRLARRDGDEWVRLFATILAPFPHSQTTDVEPCTEGNMEGVQDEVAEACKQTDIRFDGLMVWLYTPIYVHVHYILYHS